MDFRTLFYWLSVADNAKTFFIVFTALFTIASVISLVSYFINSGHGEEDNQTMSRKWLWYTVPFTILFWSLFIFTPSRKDALLIVAGGTTLNYLSTDSTAQTIPKDLLNFVSTELKQMASDAKVELGINKTKEQILNEAKNMSSAELIENMRDSTFAKIILGK